ncbi:unnamed protein product [Symbiodinium natans]|uniref:Uncharacterized protein n=1 Tax=Symbiodinium natans TaxID=878477 RepID=A0A812T7Z4_9DINO|nr:unnamed protein product [Symbiodinium natans]
MAILKAFHSQAGHVAGLRMRAILAWLCLLPALRLKAEDLDSNCNLSESEGADLALLQSSKLHDSSRSQARLEALLQRASEACPKATEEFMGAQKIAGQRILFSRILGPYFLHPTYLHATF